MVENLQTTTLKEFPKRPNLHLCCAFTHDYSIFWKRKRVWCRPCPFLHSGWRVVVLVLDCAIACVMGWQWEFHQSCQFFCSLLFNFLVCLWEAFPLSLTDAAVRRGTASNKSAVLSRQTVKSAVYAVTWVQSVHLSSVFKTFVVLGRGASAGLVSTEGILRYKYSSKPAWSTI